MSTIKPSSAQTEAINSAIDNPQTNLFVSSGLKEAMQYAEQQEKQLQQQRLSQKKEMSSIYDNNEDLINLLELEIIDNDKEENIKMHIVATEMNITFFENPELNSLKEICFEFSCLKSKFIELHKYSLSNVKIVSHSLLMSTNDNEEISKMEILKEIKYFKIENIGSNGMVKLILSSYNLINIK